MASVGLNESPQNHSILETNNIDGLNDTIWNLMSMCQNLKIFWKNEHFFKNARNNETLKLDLGQTKWDMI